VKKILFSPKTERLEKLSKLFPKRIKELEKIFNKRTSVYIDYANVFHWSKKLNWHIDLKRLKQLLDSFKMVQKVRFYNGFLKGDKASIDLIKEAEKANYEVCTKPVKIIKISIDVSGIPQNSPSILEKFIKLSLLRLLDLSTIEYLNDKLRQLNQRGILFIEHRKCNFDVEISRDILLDFERNKIENFVLWSGDSDFADLVSQLQKNNRNVFIFATARRVSVELAQTRAPIFEIKKIKEFICWPREVSDNIKNRI